MMKKLIYGGLFLAIVGMVVIGCKKDKLSRINKDSIVQNRNNPEDSIGYFHNKMVRYLLLNNSKGAVDNSHFIELIKNYLIKTYNKNVADKISSKMITYEKNKSQANIYLKSIPTGDLSTKKGIVEAWVTEGKISNKVSSYYKNLINSLSKLDSTTNSKGYIPVINRISEIENNIQNDVEINDVQESHFLMVSSVARYSIYYWYEFKTGGIVVNNPNGPTPSAISWKRVVAIAFADLKGAVDHIDDPITAYLATSGGWLAGLYVAGWAAVNSAVAYYG